MLNRLLKIEWLVDSDGDVALAIGPVVINSYKWHDTAIFYWRTSSRMHDYRRIVKRELNIGLKQPKVDQTDVY